MDRVGAAPRRSREPSRTAQTQRASQVVEAALARIAARDPALNAFTDVTAERALAQAQRDRRGARSEASRWGRSPACRSR